jgi:hypothetical protein
MSNLIINNHSNPATHPDRFKAHLLDIIARGGDIGKIIQAGSRALGNPIHVLSASEELIAKAGTAPESEKIWHMIEDIGFPPLPDYPHNNAVFNDYTRVYSQLHLDHINIRSSEVPRILSAVSARGRVMGININFNSRFAGNIYVLETNRPFSPADSKLLTALAQAVSHLLMNDDFYRTMNGESHEYLLSQLLTREDHRDADIHDRVGAIMPGLGHYLAVLAAFGSVSRDNKDLRTFRAGAANLLPSSHSAIIQGKVIVLIDGDQPNLLTPPLETELVKLLKTSHLRGGLSNTFTDYAKIRSAWQQSVQAIHFGQTIHPVHKLYRFPDYLPHHFLEDILPRADLLAACDPALMNILEHDQQYKTEYTKTLEKYVSCVGNVTEAARSLHIHYNTMKFRMEKISRFFENCEINAQRRMLLFLSFRILELLGHAVDHHSLAGSDGLNL